VSRTTPQEQIGVRAQHAPQGPDHMALMGEAYFKRNLADRKLAPRQQGPCTLDTPPDNVGVHWHACGAFELGLQV